MDPNTRLTCFLTVSRATTSSSAICWLDSAGGQQRQHLQLPRGERLDEPWQRQGDNQA
jgi:hypothetical protein